MAFENAIITKEDDEKYGLSKLFYQFNPTYKTLPDGKSWVVDKNADCWFMETKFFKIRNTIMHILRNQFGLYIVKER